MRYEEFVDRVQAMAGLDDRVAAERITQATLETLVESLPPELGEYLIGRLPHQLGEALRDRTVSGARSPTAVIPEAMAFIEQVARRAGLGEVQVASCACAVLDVVRETARVVPGA